MPKLDKFTAIKQNGQLKVRFFASLAEILTKFKRSCRFLRDIALINANLSLKELYHIISACKCLQPVFFKNNKPKLGINF
jgi:hypothetical protein